MTEAAINAAGLAFKQALDWGASLERRNLSHHLGYPPGAEKPEAASNHATAAHRMIAPIARRQSRGSRRCVTGEGSCELVLPPKHARRFMAGDDSIIALYARGLTVREIQGYLVEAYGTEVGHDLIQHGDRWCAGGSDGLAEPSAGAGLPGGFSSMRCG